MCKFNGTRRFRACTSHINGYFHKIHSNIVLPVGLGGFGVTWTPRDPKFAGSIPAEVDGFFSGSKNPEHKSTWRDFKLGVPNLRFQAR